MRVATRLLAPFYLWYVCNMDITFETELEIGGRWIAEVPELPGVMAYGQTELQAIGFAEALALRALAERIENDEASPMSINVHIAAE